MLLRVSHTTRYIFEEPVGYGLQQVRLTPKSRSDQTVRNWGVTIENGERQADYEDQNNNYVELFSVAENSEAIIIQVDGLVETTNNSGVIGRHGGFAPLWYFQRVTPRTKPGPQIRKLVRKLVSKSDDEISRLHELSQFILSQMKYDIEQTHAGTTAEDALAAGHGVCQDHSHVFVAAARLLGFPARYVSGYLMMNDRVDQDATHAWAEAFVKGIGWIGFDVSNGISPDERYIRVATGLDYSECAPVNGMRFGAGFEKMDVKIQVQQQ